MPKILVCQHVAYEILGTLNPLLRKAKFRIRYINFGRHPDEKPDLNGYEGLVILGGPMNVDQQDQYPHLKTEIALIQEAVEKNIPVLGICLGAQLVAKALGANVVKNKEKEIGWYDISLTQEGKSDPIFSNFLETEKIFQWHGYTFTIPSNAVHLALSNTCKNQAFRYKNNVYGFQFHLEVDEAMINRWLTVPIHLCEIESLKGKIDASTIQKETTLYIDHLKQLSQKTFKQWMTLFS